MRAYKRVLLKISGEALAGRQPFGIDPSAISSIAAEIRKAKRPGVKMAVVIGGGNIWRGGKMKIAGIDRSSADYMGMLATIINAVALQNVLEHQHVEARVQSALEVPKVCEPFNRRRAKEHFEKGRVVIFAGGTGNPYFTTDTAAALRAVELDADVLLKATQVDGVYDSDPKVNRKAKRYSALSFAEAIQRRLKVMDATAFTLCMENNLPVIVFNLHKQGNIRSVIDGKPIGTLVKN